MLTVYYHWNALLLLSWTAQDELYAKLKIQIKSTVDETNEILCFQFIILFYAMWTDFLIWITCPN